MLRALQLGIGIADLELLTIGEIIDMHTEAINDRPDDEDGDGEREATQEDYNKF